MATLFKKRTLIGQICLMAIMAAINVVFSFLSDIVPFLGVILVIFMPLTSAIVETACEDKYFPIYAFATIGLSVVVTLSSFTFTLFYVVPSIVSGFIFGFMNKKNLPGFLSVFVASVIQTGLSFAFIPLMNFVTERDFIGDIMHFLNIPNSKTFDNFIILIFFGMSLVQTILSYIAVMGELKKFGVKKEPTKDYSMFVNICVTASILLMIGTSFLNLKYAFLFLGFSWYFGIFTLVKYVKSFDTLFLVISGSLLFISMFIYAAFNRFIPGDYQFLLFGVYPVLLTVLSFSFYFLKKQKCNIQ